MAVASALWDRRDALLALLLAIAYAVEIAVAPASDDRRTSSDRRGHPGRRHDRPDPRGLFLLSLAVRVRAPLVPLALAFPPLALGGTGPLDASLVLLAGVLLACYSVGAWTNGREAALGGLGVGALIGLAVLRQPTDPLAARDIATVLLLLGGAWLIGIVVREVRVARGHPLLSAGPRTAAEDVGVLSPEHQGIARELRDVIERSLSVVVLQARAGLRSLDARSRACPPRARRHRDDG